MRLAGLVFGVLLAAGRSESADPQIERLGHGVRPLSQAVALDLDPRLPDYTGSVDVVLDVARPVRSIAFHSEDIDLLRITLVPKGAASTSIPLTPTPLADGVVRAASTTTVPKGRYTLHIDFKNNFDTAAKGLYRLKTGDEWYAYTQFEAIEAREAFPCWDEPSFKIPYRLTLTAPAEHTVIANTEPDRVFEKNGKRTTEFRTTRPLPSYLVALAVGPFELVPIPGTSIPARVVTVKGQSALAAEAVAVTPPLLAALEKYFGSRHPYEKLDLLAVPEYWYGAMENPGAITFVDRILLLDPKSIDTEAKERLVEIMAHEIGHMWFGDLVTMAWWDDLWLNEGFATWIADKITAEVHPEFHSQVAEVKSAQRVMVYDSLRTTRAIRQPVRSVDSLLQSADTLAYQKGSAVLHMIERWIGPAEFRAGVLAYLKEHADANATAADLWSALSKASGKDVASTLSSFLDRPGVPLVSIELLPGGRAKLSQSRFLNAGATPPRDALWKIPVTLRYPAGGETKTQTILLTRPSQTVTLKTKTTPEWIHPNADDAGYYRWSVPAETFALMAARAGSTLNTRERVGFLGNAEALLDSGRLSGEDYVKMLEAFASDPEPEVVGSVVVGLNKIRHTFFAEGRDADVAPFVRKVLAPALRRFGAEKRAGEAERVTALRPELLEALGDAGRDETVLAEMERLAVAYLVDSASVDPALVDTAIRLSVIRGDAVLFDRYRAVFETATVPGDRRRFLSALGNFRDPAVADRARAYVLSGPLRPQEILSIPRVQAEIPAEAGRAYAWMTAHYDELAARIPADFMVFMPYFADGCSNERIVAAKAFFSDPRHAPPGTSTELSRVAESVGDCVTLNAREGESVRRYATTVH